MLTGANELGGRRLAVALPGQLVDVGKPDVVPRHLILLARGRPGERAFGQLPREARTGRKRERACGDATAEDAVEVEGAGIAAAPELNLSARAGQLRGGQPFELIDRDVRSVRGVQFREAKMDDPFLLGRTELPRAWEILLRGLNRVGGGPQDALRPGAQIRQEAERLGGLTGGFGNAGVYVFRR